MNNMILNSLMTNLSNGVVTFVLGMGIVFIVLILLIYIIKAITAIVRGKPQQEVSAPAVQPADPVPEIVSAPPVEQQEDEEEIVAVIAAAVAAIAAAEGTRLNIRSFRRVGAQAPAWSRAGREDIMANRF